MILPDLTASEPPIRAFQSGKILLLLSRDVPSSPRQLNPLRIEFPFVLTAGNIDTKAVLLIVALENSSAMESVLTVSKPDGTRLNLGGNPALVDEAMFVAAAQTIVKEQLQIDLPFTELQEKPVRTWRKQGKVIAVALAIVVSLVIGFWKDIVAPTPAPPPSQKTTTSAPPSQPEWIPVEYDPFRLRPFEHGKSSFRAMPKEARNAPIRILTTAGDNYFVKLVRRSDATAIMTATIQGGTPFETRLPGGEYELRYAAGKFWYGEADLFGKDTAFAKTDRFISVSTDGIRTVQLILQRNGNLPSSTIPREKF